MGANIEGLMAQQAALHSRIQAVALKSAMEKALHDAAMQIISSMK